MTHEGLSRLSGGCLMVSESEWPGTIGVLGCS